MSITKFDVVIVGAGAAGLMCAAVAGRQGKTVLLIDHATRLAEKIRISGGGRCNFTNVNAAPQHYLSRNPHFCKSALSRYTPQDFLSLVKRYRIGFHEKHKGQLFCDNSAEDIIVMLKAECDQAGVQWRTGCAVQQVARSGTQFRLDTDRGPVLADAMVVAAGGLSIPKIGATDFAYRIARQFDVRLVDTRPGLVPLTFDPVQWQPLAALSGVALPVEVEADLTVAGDGTPGAAKDKASAGQQTGVQRAKGGKRVQPLHGHFQEDLLFTHRGLSGPAILQISSFWQPGAPLRINLLPMVDVAETLIADKTTVKKNLGNVLAQWMPARLAEGWLALNRIDHAQKVADMSDKSLRQLGDTLNRWRVTPGGSEGYRKAEVTVGGIDTTELSQQSMMVNKVPGLYFIGEAVDVTGWLGGYNFQWAWASGTAAGLAIGSGSGQVRPAP